MLASRVPAAILGRAFATFGATVQAAAITGYFVGGALVELLPIRPTVAALGVAGLAVVTALLPPVLRAIHRERAETMRGAGLATPSGGA